jgi:hypothetical protein
LRNCHGVFLRVLSLWAAITILGRRGDELKTVELS